MTRAALAARRVFGHTFGDTDLGMWQFYRRKKVQPVNRWGVLPGHRGLRPAALTSPFARSVGGVDRAFGMFYRSFYRVPNSRNPWEQENPSWMDTSPANETATTR